MAKLPLDRYLQWGSGSGKSLTLNCMLSILLDIKTTGDWKYALRHVPRRKVVDENVELMYNRAPKDRSVSSELLSGDKFSLRYDRSDKYKKYDKGVKKGRSKDFVKKLLSDNS